MPVGRTVFAGFPHRIRQHKFALGTCGPSDTRVAKSAKRLTSGFGGKEDIVNRPKRTTRRNGGLQQRPISQSGYLNHRNV